MPSDDHEHQTPQVRALHGDVRCEAALREVVEALGSTLKSHLGHGMKPVTDSDKQVLEIYRRYHVC